MALPGFAAWRCSHQELRPGDAHRPGSFTDSTDIPRIHRSHRYGNGRLAVGLFFEMFERISKSAKIQVKPNLSLLLFFVLRILDEKKFYSN